MPKQSNKLGHTSLNANWWHLPLADGTEQRVNHWRDLNWDLAADDAVASQPFDDLHALLLSDLEISRELGSGGYGRAYSCRLASPRYAGAFGGPLVIKLPILLIDAGLLTANRNTRRLVRRSLYTPQHRQQHALAVREFKQEFLNYEKLMEPSSSLQRGGALVIGITNMQHAQMRHELARLEQHPGHAHLHRILHFDAQIPAILSERCDGTLEELRASRPDLFEANYAFTTHKWTFSETWKQVGRELCDAVDYIKERGLVHIDTKVSNVFYSMNPAGQLLFQLGDYGLIDPDTPTTTFFETTRYYQPSDWIQQPGALYNPMTLCAYTIATVMVCCLKLPSITFPVCMDTADFHQFWNMDAEIQDFRDTNLWGEVLFPRMGLIPLRFEEEVGAAWSHVVLILEHDYLNGSAVDIYPLVQAFRSALL